MIRLLSNMNKKLVSRWLTLSLILAGLLAGAHWLWTTPLDCCMSKASLGTLNLEQDRAQLPIRFVPPKDLCSLSIVFSKPIVSGENCSNPDFPLSFRLRIVERNGASMVDTLITKEQMQWTNWHEKPSLCIWFGSSVSRQLSQHKEYDLTLSVNSPVPGLGTGEVFLHWGDRLYVWGRDEQRLQITKLPNISLASPPTKG